MTMPEDLTNLPRSRRVRFVAAHAFARGLLAPGDAPRGTYTHVLALRFAETRAARIAARRLARTLRSETARADRLRRVSR